MIHHYHSKAHRRRIGVVPYDVDAQIYFDAIIANSGALSTLEKDGYNVYRIDSKDNANPWNSENHLDYPMVGGTVESMVINAKNPGTFDAIAVNTISSMFTANGYKGNGTDSYFRMGLIASVTLTIQSVGLEIYSRTDVSEASNCMGVIIDGAQTAGMIIRRDITGDKSLFDAYTSNNGSGRLIIAQTSSLGGYLFTRLASNDQKVYRNASEYGSNAGSGGTQPTIEFYLGALNSNSSPANFSTREYAGAGIYDGLIPAKVLSQYTARQVFNTTLTRQV